MNGKISSSSSPLITPPSSLQRPSPQTTSLDIRQFVTPSRTQRIPTDRVEPQDWSGSLKTVLDVPPANFPQYLLSWGLAFGVIFGAWAWFGKIEEVSYAKGHLVPEGHAHKVQPSVNGEIQHLLVKEGDRVKAGQTIAELDHSLIQDEIDRLEEALLNYESQLFQTNALIEKAYLELRMVKSAAHAEADSKQVEIIQTKTDVETYKQISEQLQGDVEAHQVRLERLKFLVKEGALGQDQLFQIEQTIRDKQQALTENLGAMQRSQKEIDRKASELTQTQATAEKYVLESTQQIQRLQIEATDLKAKIKETQSLIAQEKTKLNQMILISPVEGTVSTLNVSNAGEVAQAGETLAEIVPDDAKLVLSALLPSHEAGLVEQGMSVNLKFDAFPYQDYGILPGTVKYISSDAEEKDKIGTVYRVEIVFDQDHIIHEGKAIDLRAGQTVTAEIIVRQQRIANLILTPFRQLREGGLSL